MPDALITSVYLIYIDESYDQDSYCYSAIFVPVFSWNHVFNKIQEWRYKLADTYGISLTHELHATNFVRGSGQPQSNTNKEFRGEIFREAFTLLENIEEIMVINAFAKNKIDYMKLFEWMLNRINRTLVSKNACGILVCDEGNESRLISVVRAMKKNNHIPSTVSRYGYNNESRNIPLDRIIEDPLFKQSKASYMIQLADFVAFGLLRNQRPAPNTHSLVQDAFNILDKVLVKKAFTNCPQKKGIIRT